MLQYPIRVEHEKISRLDGEKIYLRPLTTEDACQEYVNWLNDPEVNQFLEIRFVKHTLEKLKDYIEKINKNPDILFLGIIREDTDAHIGNIKLGPIDWNHRVGDIGIMIGDKSSWGRGYAREAIKLLSDYAFNMLKLHKLEAGAYENNIGSIKAFLKVGFSEEGRKRKRFRCKDTYVDQVSLGRINEGLHPNYASYSRYKSTPR